MLKQIEDDIKRGWVAGPFDRAPFPNDFSPYQPEICRVFAIKKNKYYPFDDSIRLIFDKSCPFPYSKNNLTPRMDAGVTYPTFSLFLEGVARLGRGLLVCRH